MYCVKKQVICVDRIEEKKRNKFLVSLTHFLSTLHLFQPYNYYYEYNILYIFSQ